MFGSLKKVVTLLTPIMVAAIGNQNFVQASQGEVEVFQGIARNETGEIVYVENHRMYYQEQRPVRNQTQYLDPRGVEFAKLISGFTSHHPYVPEYRFEDNRFGRKGGAEVEGDRVTVYGQKFANQPLRKDTLPLTDRTIAGQGLHLYIQDHLGELETGAEKKVDFLFPLESESYNFRIRRLDKPDTEAGTLWLRIEIDNWFFRLFAPHVEVQYDMTTKKLLTYRGISNLLDANKKMQNVRITYQYLEFHHD